MKERFTHKFVNSYWVVFDNANYENVQICMLAKEAVYVCNQMNRRIK